MGRPNSTLYRCEVLLNAYGLEYGAVEWLSGDKVEGRIATGSLRLVP